MPLDKRCAAPEMGLSNDARAVLTGTLCCIRMAHVVAHVMRGARMFCKWIQMGSAGQTDCARRDHARPIVAGS